jgi:GNAT superfamily N-acetyltransferase
LGESDRSVEARVVSAITPEQAPEAVTVLCDAFREYPVMRHVIGRAGDEYDNRLTALVDFFVAARMLRREPILAVEDGRQVAAVALLTSPGDREAPAELETLREYLWRELGRAARTRYETLGRVWQRFTYPKPHYHLNMIGVLRSHTGRGLGRRLLDAVHGLSYKEPGSRGVSLTTEDSGNVELYLRFGYEIVGHANVSNAFETWGFFRTDRAETL